VLNDIGAPGWIGMAPLPVDLAPQEEMQLAQAWHAIVSFVLMAIIIAHIYIGSVGMQGAYDAMGSGEVDEAWAHQHHSIWLDEVKAKQAKAGKSASPDATPAE
jgi:formate dehydrogenase subunit gamma